VEAPVGQHDVGRRRFEQVGGERRRPGDELHARLVDGGATLLRRARAVGAAADRHEVGVAVHHPHRVHRYAELLGGDHRPRRVVTLSVR
jgi:hypothetical protein